MLVLRYGPLLSAAWQREIGMTEARMRAGNMPLIFGGSFRLNVLTALCMRLLIRGFGTVAASFSSAIASPSAASC
jgi:hypothetical protein